MAQIYPLRQNIPLCFIFDIIRRIRRPIHVLISIFICKSYLGRLMFSMSTHFVYKMCIIVVIVGLVLCIYITMYSHGHLRLKNHTILD